MGLWRWLLAAAVLFLQAQGACASYNMSMNVSSPAFAAGGSAPIEASLRNFGDEDAYRGVVTVAYPPALRMPPLQFDRISPGAPAVSSANASVDGGALPGTYQAVFSLVFRDRNDYPIYIEFDSSFDAGKATSSDVTGSLADTAFIVGESGTLRLKVTNSGAATRNVSIRMFVPSGLDLDRSRDTLALAAGESRTLEYAVSNVMAIPGSGFTAFAVMEYDDDAHHSSKAKAVVSYGPRPQPLLEAAAFAAGFAAVGAYAAWRLRR
jgi:hypothetical protein